MCELSTVHVFLFSSFWEGRRKGKKSIRLINVAFDVVFGASKAHNLNLGPEGIGLMGSSWLL